MDNNQALRRVQRAKVSLSRSPLFARWSAIIMMGESRIDNNCPTAYTDGYNDRYNAEFIGKLNDKMISFVVLHENMHKGARHLVTYRKLWEIDAHLTNVACDHWINLSIVDSDPNGQVVQLPELDGKQIGMFDTRFRGMSVKQIFDILREEQEKNGGSGEGGFDHHGWDEANGLPEKEQEAQAQEIERGLRQGRMAAEKLAGKNGSSAADRLFDELLKPKVNWREQLREFVSAVAVTKDVSSWRKVNRRMMAQGFTLPSLVGESIERMALCLDMSGSTWSPQYMNAFMSELRHVVEQVRPNVLDIIYWDTEVTGHETHHIVDPDTLLTLTKPKGGGGTDPQCIVDYMSEKNIRPECIVVLTDGEVFRWGDGWSAPVLWAIANQNGDHVSPIGKTIKVEL